MKMLAIGKLLANFWKPSGVIYLGFCLIGFISGLWVDVIYVNPNTITTAAVPVFHTLGLSQVLFFLLVWPLTILRRNKTIATSISAAVIEFIGFFIASVPFYFVGARFSDATMIDFLRTIITVSPFCLFGLAAGRLMTYRGVHPWVLLGLVIITIAPIGIYYIFSEFLYKVPAEWIWNVAPVSFTWTNSTQRIPAILPKPLWVWYFWIFIGISLCVIRAKTQIKSPCKQTDLTLEG